MHLEFNDSNVLNKIFQNVKESFSFHISRGLPKIHEEDQIVDRLPLIKSIFLLFFVSSIPTNELWNYQTCNQPCGILKTSL